MSAAANSAAYWRIAGMSYLKYANACAEIVRGALKEPHLSKVRPYSFRISDLFLIISDAYLSLSIFVFQKRKSADHEYLLKSNRLEREMRCTINKRNMSKAFRRRQWSRKFYRPTWTRRSEKRRKAIDCWCDPILESRLRERRFCKLRIVMFCSRYKRRPRWFLKPSSRSLLLLDYVYIYIYTYYYRCLF